MLVTLVWKEVGVEKASRLKRMNYMCEDLNIDMINR